MRAVPLGLGLGASAALLVEYSASAPALCQVGGGCDQVRQSALASVGGIPTPILGVLFFSALIVLQALPGRRTAHMTLAAMGAMASVVFLGVQAWVVEAFCKYCVVVDASAIAYLGLLLVPNRPAPVSPSIRPPLVSLATAAIVGLAIFTTAPGSTSQPGNLGALAPANTKARLTITEFVDFQCPACRSLHRELQTALAPWGDQIDVVRHHLPLAQHAHAETAARAYCCAEESGKAEAMADQLFVADDLGEKDCEDLAVGVGVDREVYRQCMASQEPAATLESDARLASELAVRALPTFFVGTRRVEGARSSDQLVALIERELE